MDPAKHVIDKFGGARACAAAIGLHVTSVHRWTYPEERGGTGGLIPRKRERELLTAAQALGISLSPLDFVSAGAEPPTPATGGDRAAPASAAAGGS